MKQVWKYFTVCKNCMKADETHENLLCVILTDFSTLFCMLENRHENWIIKNLRIYFQNGFSDFPVFSFLIFFQMKFHVIAIYLNLYLWNVCVKS